MQIRNFYKWITAVAIALLVTYLRAAGYLPEIAQEAANEEQTAAVEEQQGGSVLARDGLCRTTYEVFVYSFCDSDGDGIGDLPGLLSKLDYINDGDPAGGEDLGMTGLWLMPVFSSNTYHKYDVTDFTGIDPAYGTLEDMEALLAACHERGMTVILDLPVNHTSTAHPWFQEAASYLRSLPSGRDAVKEECPYVWYYQFAREQYDGYVPLPDSEWYYEARSWSEMPDLNLTTGEVRQELGDVIDFWLDRGVDGFRLDAVTSYYTDNPEAGIEFTRWLTDTAKNRNPSAYIVGEAWADQNTYAQFYRSGIDSLFDFAFAGRDGTISRVVNGAEGLRYFAESMVWEEELYASLNPAFVNAPFYTNHDMDRGAEYYAGGDPAIIKLAEALNLLMTGNAFIYYGEELGMKGAGRGRTVRIPELEEDRFVGFLRTWPSEHGADDVLILINTGDTAVTRRLPDQVAEYTDLCAALYTGERNALVNDNGREVTVPAGGILYLQKP